MIVLSLLIQSTTVRFVKIFTPSHSPKLQIGAAAASRTMLIFRAGS